MNCNELKADLALYSDNTLSPGQNAVIAGHLLICPLCRETLHEFRELRVALRGAARPQVPEALVRSIQLSVSNAAGFSRPVMFASPVRNGDWLRRRLMPVAVGFMASVVVGFGMLNFLFNGSQVSIDGASVKNNSSSETGIMLASNREPYQSRGGNSIISASDYARNRLAVSAESPSINPQGALVGLTKSFLRGRMKDEEVVVVADVFSNGLATITEVVEPSNSSRAIYDLQRALDSDLGDAPFVPAFLDQRSDNVRVVLKFNSVDVSTRNKRRH